MGLINRKPALIVLSAIGAVVAFPLVASAQRHWDKRSILITCALLNLTDGMILVILRFLDLLPVNGDPKLPPILVGAGAISAGLSVVQGIIGASIVADILDYHEAKTGLRQEAMFNAALSFSGKVASGIGIIGGGLLLTFIALPPQSLPDQVPNDVITRLGVTVGLILPVFYLIPIFLIRRYRITREMHRGIRADLARR